MPEMDPRGEAAAQSSEAARQFLSERVTRALNRRAQQELVLMFGLDQRQGYRIFFLGCRQFEAACSLAIREALCCHNRTFAVTEANNREVHQR